jgi:hypothetical protein
LPVSPETLRTQKEGQVSGLSKSRVQAILNEYGILRVLAEEGGRTSRGSLGNAADYANFLHGLNPDHATLKKMEKWWVDRVRDFFNAKPFTLRFDESRSLRSIVSDLLAQAMKRQKENPGMTCAGTMLQHLVGAKQDLILPEEKRILHHGANTADAPTSRAGDFLIDDVVIHVTTAPTEALIRKCKQNIDAGLRAVIVTITESRAGIESLAKHADIENRIDVIEAEQFIATNILEWSHSRNHARKTEVSRLAVAYNALVEAHETDPSLRIDF